MKLIRLLIISTFVFLVVPQGSAQAQKKAAFFGLSGGIADFGKKEDITGPYYHIQPGLGFFLNQNLVFGTFINISSFEEEEYPYTAVGLGTFLRLTEQNAFIQGGFDFGVATDELYEYSKFTFAVGYSFFTSKSIALEPHLFYAAHNESGTSYDFGGLGVGISIQCYLYAKVREPKVRK